MRTVSQQRLMPKYAQVMSDIVERIERGEYELGQAIPALPVLARKHSVNRLTVMRALKSLAQEGYISIEHGRGSFVRRKSIRPHIGMLFGDNIFDPHSTPFTPLLAKSAQDFFHEKGLELKFYVEHSHLIPEGIPNRDLVYDLEHHTLRGLITANSDAPIALAKAPYWKRHQIPHVDISCHEVAPYRVSIQWNEMLDLGLSFVQQQGRHRVGVIGLSRDRVQDVRHLMEEVSQRGLRTTREWLPLQSLPAEEEGYRAMLSLWKFGEKPDALIILDDIMAKGAVQAMLQLNIQVPSALLVVSHANKGSGIFYPLSMPKLELDPAEYISEAGNLLLALMVNPSLPNKTILIRPKLRLDDTVRDRLDVVTSEITSPVTSTD